MADAKQMRAARCLAYWKGVARATTYRTGREIAERAHRDVAMLASALGVDTEDVEAVELATEAEDEAPPSAAALFRYPSAELVPAGAVEADDAATRGEGETRCRALTAAGRRCRHATDGTAFCEVYHDDLNDQRPEVKPAA